MSLFNDRLKQLWLVAWIEGLSYLFLLLVAMPMKYIAGQPEWVRTGGMVHGVLFVLFSIVALQTKIELRWSGRQCLRVWLTAFIPFGMVLLDRYTRGGEQVAG